MTDETKPGTNRFDDPSALRLDQKTDDGKARMSEYPAKSEVKQVEALASSENAAGDGKANGSASAVAVVKPGAFDLNKFKSKHADAIANVDTLQTGLPMQHVASEGLRAVAPGRRERLVA
jgi:hypothetical protein